MQRSFGPRSGIIIVLATVFVIGYFSVRSHSQFESTVIAQTHDQLLTTARSISVSIREHVQILSQILKIVSENQTVQAALKNWDPRDRRFDGRLLSDILQAHVHHADALLILDARGRVVHQYPPADNPRNRHASLADRPDVARVLELKLPYVSDPFYTQAGDLAFTISQPIFARAGGVEFVGIARWVIKIRTIAGLFATHVRIGESGYAQIIDGSGMLLAHPDEKQIGRHLMEEPRKLFPAADWSSFGKIAENMTAGKEGTAVAGLLSRTDDGRTSGPSRQIIAYTPILFEDHAWSVLLSLDFQEVAAPVHASAQEHMLFAIAIISIIVYVGWKHLQMQRRLAAEESANQITTFLETLPIGILVLTADGRPFYANSAVGRIFGKTDSGDSGDNALQLLSSARIAGTDTPFPRERLPILRALAGERSSSSDIEVSTPDRTVPLELHGYPIHTEAGALRFAVGALLDITERFRMEQSIIQARQDWEDTFNMISDSITIQDNNFNIIASNKAANEVLRLKTEAGERSKCFIHIHGTDQPPQNCASCQCMQADRETVTEVFEPHLGMHIEVRAIPRFDPTGDRKGLIHIIRDISDRKRLEDELKHRALYDSLTKLPNRALFLDRLTNLIAHQQRQDDLLFAVLFVDLDHFKKINDTAGHEAGDKLLVAVADRLRNNTRPGDTVSRFGGDEFLIIVDALNNRDDAIAAAERIHQAFTATFAIDGNDLYITASIGIALSSQDGKGPEDLIRNADVAMYHAKTQGRSSYAVFDRAMHHLILESVKMENELRNAVRRREFVNHYQPVIDITSGRVSGFEALTRWMHPAEGLLSPAKFIPIAEETGMITAIGEWAIRDACMRAKKWQEQYPDRRDLFVSVNVSAKQFSGTLPRIVGSILEETGLDAGALRIEITESLLMEHRMVAHQVLTELRAMNVMVYLDDFGTGYSSLNYLHKFPINALKIDQTFVTNIVKDHQAQEIIRAITTLAASLKLTVIVEGVERIDQLDFFRSLQCNLIQGFLFSRPVEHHLAERFITTTLPME
ncbi:MAG: EAL domain-containing protein [Nitrospirota bacterium]|nr:EAL domain-containing protein [Nitrospirota bacterium]